MSIESQRRLGQQIYVYSPMFISLALIFYFSSLSSLPIVHAFNGQDKVHHFIAFFTLGYSLFRYCAFNSFSKKQTIFIVILCGTLYGFSDEIHQLYVPNRVFDWYDLLADFTGCIAAFILGPKLFLLDKNLLKRLAI